MRSIIALIPFGVELRGVPAASGVTEGGGGCARKVGVSLGLEKWNASWAAMLFVELGPGEDDREGTGEGAGAGAGAGFWELIAIFGFSKAAGCQAATCGFVISPSSLL